MESGSCKIETNRLTAWPGLFEKKITGYLLDKSLSSGFADSGVCFVNTYPLDGDLAGG